LRQRALYTSKETYKRGLHKNAYQRDLQQRSTKETYKRDLRKGPVNFNSIAVVSCMYIYTKRALYTSKLTLKRGLHPKPTKEAYKRELQKRPTKETYKRGLQKSPV